MEIHPPISINSPTSPSSPRSPRGFSPRASANNPFQAVKTVSILNFDKNAIEVVFTEPLTIEALKRLGYTNSDFNFKPLVSFYSNSPVDNNSTMILYQKYINRRQEMIDRTIEMRQYLIDSSDDNSSRRMNGTVRKAKFDADNKLNTFHKIENDDKSTLKKLAVAKLRDMSREKEDMGKSMRTIERFHDIDEANFEKTKFVNDLRNTRGFRYSESSLPSIFGKPGTMNMTMSSTNNFSIYRGDSYQCSQYLTNTLGMFDDARLSFQLSSTHSQSVRDRKNMLYEDKMETNINRLNEKARKNEIYQEALARSNAERIHIKRKIMKQRAKSARTIHDSILQRDMDQVYEEFEENRERDKIRIATIQQRRNYQTLTRKMQLEEKLQNVRHSYNAKTYQAQLQKEQQFHAKEGAASEALMYRQQNREIDHQRYLEKLDFQAAKISLNRELQNLTDPEEDIKGLRRIAKVIGVSRKELNQMVNQAVESKDELKMTPMIVTGRKKPKKDEED